MAFLVEVDNTPRLSDYASVAHLVAPVQELQREAQAVLPKLRGRTVWMVNSTPQGGGVAEMLPTIVSLLRDLGVPTEWAVIESDEPAFFALTKQIHNLIHGDGLPEFHDDARALFERVNEENAAFLRERVRPGDILIVHDPQPMPLATLLHDRELRTVWRCHIGLDHVTPATQGAWTFLSPYESAYEHAVFSAPEYIPPMFADRASVIFPGINPLTPKNRDLDLHHTIGILSNAGLVTPPGPLLTPPYAHQAQRLDGNGTFQPANAREDFGLLTRPIVTQISRWDRLKGFEPLLMAFADYKRGVADGRFATDDPVHRRRQDLVRMVLAGPDPASIQDDPEGREVLEELKAAYAALEPGIQESIALIALPMDSRHENALMVNALQRASSIVVQNSLREGFGLTVTEAMWKRVPILSNAQACGPRHQVRDRVDGRLVADPTDTDGLARTLDEMLQAADDRAEWGRNAQRHVHERFLIFTQLREWMHLFSHLL